MSKEIIRDIICQVLFEKKSKEIIISVLNKFLPNYEEIYENYGKPNDDEYEFKSENELISYYGEIPNITQTLYWNQKSDNSDNIMVGVNVTEDNKIIFSLTLDGTEETESKYYRKLKDFLNSETGVISYVDPVFYENGKDFKQKYKNNKYDFEK